MAKQGRSSLYAGEDHWTSRMSESRMQGGKVANVIKFSH